MAATKKKPVPTTSPPEPDVRTARLAQPAFFTELFICQHIIGAQLPAGENVVHQLAIDLEAHALHCSCVFRPKPCQHIFALHALYIQSAGADFTAVEDLPGWAISLLNSEGGSLAKTTPDRQISRQQRRYERLERAAAGFDDLEEWLSDTIRRGLAMALSEDPNWYAGIAARLADASLGGLSRQLRLLSNIPTAGPDWAEKTLAVLAEAYLAVRAFRQSDVLPEPLVLDLQNWLGINAKKEEVLARGERLRDLWAVVGQVQEVMEEKLQVRRTWLLGLQSRRYGLLVDYTFGGAPFVPGFATGSIQRGTLVWYPSAWPQRALALEDFEPVSSPPAWSGYVDFQSFANDYARAVGIQPWLALFPAVFLEVTVFFQHERLYMQDNAGKILPLHTSESVLWRLLALAGGAPVQFCGEWNGDRFKALTVVIDGRIVSL